MIRKTVKIGLIIAIVGLTIIGATFVFRAKGPLDKEEVTGFARGYVEEWYNYIPVTEVKVEKIELHQAELLPIENATELLGRWVHPEYEYLPAKLPDKMWLVEFDVELTIKYLRIGKTAVETRRTHAIIDGYTGDHLVFLGGEILTQEFPSLNENIEENYVPGAIVVGFIDNVTENQVRGLVESFGFSLITYCQRLNLLAEYRVENSVEIVAAEIEKSDIVYQAIKVGGLPRIHIRFNSGVTYDEGIELISSFENLEFIMHLSPPWGVVGVPIGQEFEWAETFESLEIVEWATLNWIGTWF